LSLAYIRRGLAYQRQRDYDRALADFGWVVKIDPKHQLAYANVANTWRLKGDLQRAAENADAGLRISPKNPLLFYTRGLIATARNAHQSAITDFTRAIELKPDLALAIYNRGEAHASLGQWDQACADIEAALNLDPRNGLALAARSSCFLERTDIEQALTAANAAIAVQPENPSAYNARGRAYRGKRDFDKAVADFDRAIQLRPGFLSALGNRGGVRRAQGQNDKAIEDFTAVLRIDPNHTGAYTDRGLTYLAKGEVEAARKDLQTAVDLPPRNALGRRSQETARNRLALLSSPSAPVGDAPAATPISPGGAPTKRVALVIGNGGYLNVARLPNPSNDARAIGAALRELGFEVIEGIDLGRAAMEQNLREFLQKSSAAQIALMFYAGHGMQVDGQNYLLPVDAKLAARTDLDFDTLSLDKIISALNDDVRANIIVLDACRDNPLAARFAAQARNRAVSAGGLAAYSSVGTGTLIAFATAPGQVAEDGDGTNSPFTAALLRHIKNAELEVRQMMTRVRAEVAASTGRKQIPWDNSSLLGEIYLARQN
jgi:tetratricopeptide (TPR) repeat protein